MRNGHDNTEIDLNTLWRSASTLVKRGWHPVPIEPNSKACKVSGWARYCSEAPDAAEFAAWGSDPRGFGMGLALGRSVDNGTVLMCLDWDLGADNEARATAVEAALGIDGCPAKAGARGWSCFVRVRGHDGSTRNAGLIGAPLIVGADGREHVQMVQLLGVGAQTVIPPTTHPDLGRPYVWLDGRSLWPRNASGRPAILPAEALPVVEWSDLVEALEDAGFDVGNLRPRTAATKPAAIDFEELDEAAVVELLDRLEFDCGDLGDLWTNGSDAKVFERRGKTASGNERRHELAYQMRKAGYDFGSYIAALREWKYTVGNKPFDVDEDLTRPNSRLVASWESAGRRLAATADATEAFAAADDGDEAGGGPGGDAKTSKSTPFAFTTAAKLRVDGPPLNQLRLVKGRIGHRRLAAIYGAPYSGKSSTAASLVHAVASGGAFDDMPTSVGGVLVFGIEDADGWQRVIAHLDKVNGGSPSPIAIVEGGPNLYRDAESVAKVVSTVHAAEAALGVKVALVVFDTLSLAMRGGDENSARDVGIVMERLAMIRDRADVTCLAIGHSGKDGAKGIRGSSLLTGDFDTIVRVADGHWSWEKIKGARGGGSREFSILETDTGWKDADGDTIRIGIVEWSAAAKAPRAARRGPAKAERPAPGTVGGEVFAALDRHGPMTMTEIGKAVAADRLSRDPDAPASTLDPDKLRRAIGATLTRWSERGAVSLVGGRWATADGLLGAHLRAISDEEAA